MNKSRFCVVVVFLMGLMLNPNSRAQLFSDSFDFGLSAWTATGGWAVSPNGAATDSVSANYANNTDVALTLAAPLDFSDVANPALRFIHRHAIEAFYDFATVEASRNGGGSWDELARFSGNQFAWLAEQIDLTAFAGESVVLIRFRLQTDASVVNDGWTIDDVLIGEIPGSALITNLVAQGFSSVLVEWAAPAGAPIQGYKVYRARTSGAAPADAVLVGQTDGATTTLTDYSIAPKNTFYYRIVAVDADGLASVSDESSIALPAGMDFPFLDNGEAGPTHWTASGDWALAPEPGNPANTCWSDSPDSPYTNSINAALTLVAPLNLSKATSPVLAFRHKLDLLTGDILSVEFSTTDGAEWASLKSFSAVTSTNRWTQENISLASAVGSRPVWIRFLLTTNPCGTADGCWLDNIAVAEAPSAVPSLLIDQVQSHSVRLSWTQNLDTLFSHYAIYRKPGTAGVDFHDTLVAEITSQSQTQFTDTGLLLNSDYVYRVYGVSSYGTLSTVTAEQTVLTQNNPLPFSDAFESGTNGWIFAGHWNIETDGTNSWLSDSPGSFYENNHRVENNYALTAVDLSVATWPVLSFRDKFNLTGSIISTDRGYLQISSNGSTWVNRYAVTGQRSEWAEQRIDLSEWAGQPNVRIRFHLWTDGAATADGWKIDDIAVAEHTPAPAQMLPLYESFEDETVSWIGGGWVINTNEAYEGSASAQSLPIAWIPANTEIYATFSHELNLFGSNAPQLTLWAKGFNDYYNRLYAQLSNNGGRNWTDISGQMLTVSGEWTRFQFAVPAAFKTQGVRLRLLAYTYNGDSATQFLVDKLTIEELPTRVNLGTPIPHLKSMDLNWSEYADDGTFQKYEVYRKESATVSLNDTLLATITNRTVTAFTDTGLSIGKSYYYKVYVYNTNDTATPSNEGQGTTVPVLPPINDPFSDLGLWDTIGSWGIETNSGGSWLSDSPDSLYENNHRVENNYALTAVDLSGSTWPVLSFRDKFNLAGMLSTDRGYLQVSINGTQWFNRYTVTGQRSAWAEQQIDLSEWAGQPNVRIRFHLWTDGAVTADGWQIDDIMIGEHTPNPALALPVYERFEDGAVNWISGGWVINTNEAYEGGTSAQSLPLKWIPSNTESYATFGRELNLAGSTSPQVTLWAKGLNDYYSRLSAQLSNNGGVSWTDISGLMATVSSGWTRFQFAVPVALKVDGVRLRLLAHTYRGDNATQFLVDKLTIEETPTQVTLGAPIPHLKSMDLNWTEYTNDGTFQKYELYRRESPGVSLGDTLLATSTNRTVTAFTNTGLSIGKSYYYKVYVYNTNDTVTPSNERQCTTVPVVLPFNDNLDDLALWDTIGSWGIETDGNNSWLSDSPGSFYNNNHRDTDNYAVTSVDLSGATWPVLSFRDKFNLTGSTSTDRGYLQISENGTAWVNRYAVTGLRAEWADQQIDLSQWAGKSNIRIRFYLYTDASVTADGWQIDDIAIEEHTPAPALALPVYERFEDGTVNWISGGWVINTNEAYEGGTSAQSLPIGWIPANTEIYATFSRELNLSGSATPQLTLWAKGLGDYYNRLSAQLSSNGGRNWTDISGQMATVSGEWTRFQFAVPAALKVDGVRLRLLAHTYSGDNATQFLVDKLTIEETPTQVTLGTPIPHLKSMDLNWTETADASTFKRYEVYRKESATVSLSDTLLATITDRTVTAFTDTGLSVGKSYYYKVYVYNTNDTATPSNERQGTTVPVALPFNDSLDDLALWDTIGSWGIETNATDSWLSDSPNSPYNNNHRETDNYVRTAVDLSGSTWPVLSFRDRFNLPGLTGTDRGYLQISIDGNNWSIRYAATGQRTEWTEQQIDLSEWAGQPNVRIRFHLWTDSAATADGWQIDDISVAEHVSTPKALPLHERFEDGTANWIGGGWVVNTNQAYEGSASAQSLPINWIPGNTQIYATFGRELNLAGSTSPQVTLWAKGLNDYYSRLSAQLSNNGGVSWTDISGQMATVSSGWTRFQFAVPAAFKTGGVRLRLLAHTYSADRATQFFVDRLTIGEVNPSAPIPLSPTDGAIVGVLYPTLTVENAVDIVDDNSSYEFEVYTNASLEAGTLITRRPVQASGDGTTSWPVDVEMIDGLQYWWRSRATSSSGYLSGWSATNTFHAVIVNHAPTEPFVLSPYAGATLPNANGSFIWMRSVDPDAGDRVAEYQLQIAADNSFGNVLLSAVETNDAAIGVMALNRVSGFGSLPLNEAYFWRIRAVDTHGLGSAWAVESFVYGKLDPVVIDPVTITDFTISGSVIRLEWAPSEHVAGVEFSPTLTPPVWEPVSDAQNLTTNVVWLTAPTNQPQGFFRVITSE